MEKSKLGISIGLLAMIMYLMGMVSSLAAVGIALFILVEESNDWLKHSAVKLLIILGVFGALSACVSVLDSSFGIVSDIVGWFKTNSIGVPLNLDHTLRLVFSIIEYAILLILALNALSMKTFKLGAIDQMIQKHSDFKVAEENQTQFQKAQPKGQAQNMQSQNTQTETKQCPNCGCQVAATATFCPKCGGKIE